MRRFAKILLVYDGTPEAKVALMRCSQLALELSARVEVVSVVDAIGMNALAGGQLSGEGFARLELLAKEAANVAAVQLQQEGVIAHGSVVFGNWGDALSRHAEISKSDMVIIGHRARKRFARWWGDQAVSSDLADRLRGSTIITVT
jgi:nucleotide-binding universal stress UspA family protein